MRPLPAAWPAIASRLRGRRVALFLDYDGTLVPIRKRPEKAVMTGASRRLLRRLAALPGVKVAIVSGRELATVRRLVGVSGIVYVGNHGLEMRGPGFRWTDPRAKSLLDSNQLLARLKRAFRDLRGILVEDKRLTISVHYRLASPAARIAARRRLAALLRGRAGRTVALRNGKKVWEIRPAIPVNKGTAVATLLRKRVLGQRVIPVYIGDDTTDEDALRVVSKSGFGIKVVSRENARARTHARYSLPSTAGTHDFLSRLHDLMRSAVRSR